MNRFFCVPVVSHQALAEMSYVESELLRDVAHDAAFAAKHDPSVVALINGLFVRRGPSAIFWRVWAAVVDAFNAVLGRRLPSHIFKESFKAITPSFAHGDAAPVVAGIAHISASRPHPSPATIFGCVRGVIASSATMLSLSLTCALSLKASAALRQSTQQILSEDHLLCAAVAKAQPRPTRDGAVHTLNNKATKSAAAQINIAFRHVRNFTPNSPVSHVFYNNIS